jgi:hypothetical protein
MCRAFRKSERRRCNVHLAITHKNVTIAPESAKTLVLVFVAIVGVEEAPMTKYKIENGITIPVWLNRIPAEDIINLPAIVLPTR